MRRQTGLELDRRKEVRTETERVDGPVTGKANGQSLPRLAGMLEKAARAFRLL